MGGLSSVVELELARGLAVKGFCALEAFLLRRVDEWSAELRTARIRPTALPDAGMRFGNRALDLLPRALRAVEESQKSVLLNDVATSLTSLNRATWEPHAVAFRWPGSNLQTSDVGTMLGVLGFDEGNVWGELTKLWQLVARVAPGAGSLKSVLEAVAGLRHSAAHQVAPNLPMPTLSAIPGQLAVVALCIDVLGTWGVRNAAAQPTAGGFKKPESVGVLKLRELRESGTKWSEFGPGATSAYRRHTDLPTAMDQARSRLSARSEIVVARNSAGEIADWDVSQLRVS